MPRTIALLVAVVIALSACAGEDTPDDSSPDASQSPTGHSHAVEIGGPADASEADKTIEVTAKDFAFDPSSIAVKEGEVIEFVITNDGTQPHEFTIGDQAFHDAAEGEGHDHAGQSTGVIQPGDSASLTWDFSSVANILFACHVEDHFERNMYGSIRVLL